MNSTKNDAGAPFSADEIHKATYFPYLIAFYLGVLLLHTELRLHIVSHTELPVTLWFFDTMLQECGGWEKKYATCNKRIIHVIMSSCHHVIIDYFLINYFS